MSSRNPGSRPLAQWTPTFLLISVGLLVVSVGFLIFALTLGDFQYSIPGGVAAIGGVTVATLGCVSWVLAAPVRRSVVTQRTAGAQAWPVRAISRNGGWTQVGTLGANAEGITVTVKGSSASAPWSELEPITLENGGLIRGTVMVVSGPRSGRLELELLEDNGVARLGDAGTRAAAATLSLLRAQR